MPRVKRNLDHAQAERACDNCHEKKLRCRRQVGGQCERCGRMGQECRFTKPIMKRGRRKKNFTDLPFPAPQALETEDFDCLLTRILECVENKEEESAMPQVFDEKTSQLDSLEEHLIMLYFRYVQPFYPLVRKDAFLGQCHLEMDGAWAMLLCTLCCVACPYLDLEPFDGENCPRQLAAHYHKMALEMLETETAQPSIFGLQSLLGLLTIEQANKERYTKLAFEMAVALGISRGVHLEAWGEYSLLWAACHMLDCHWSLVYNTSPFFQDPPPPLPKAPDDASEIFLNSPNSTFISIPPELSMLFHHQYSQLSPIMEKISSNLQKPLALTGFRKDAIALFEAKFHEASAINALLHQWLETSVLCLSQMSWGEAGFILLDLLRIYYHTLVIHIFLPFAIFHAKSNHLTKDYVQICIHSAQAIVALGTSLGDYFVIYGHHFRNHSRLFAWIVFHLFDPTAQEKEKLIHMARCRLQFKFGLSTSQDAIQDNYRNYSRSILANLGVSHLSVE